MPLFIVRIFYMVASILIGAMANGNGKQSRCYSLFQFGFVKNSQDCSGFSYKYIIFSQNQEKFKIIVDELRSLIIIIVVMTKVSRRIFVAPFCLLGIAMISFSIKHKTFCGDAHSQKEEHVISKNYEKCPDSLFTILKNGNFLFS